MSAQIYAAPKELKQPKIDFANYGKYTKECKEYLDKLKEYCLENSDEEYVGEIVRIPHADGNAEYMVASMKPLELIHIPLGDAYHSEFAELLTVEKVKEKIQGAKKMAEIFGKKSK